ncbi:MAG: hypothetical protein NVS9B15_23170 [Acidobacteriaceae bacterium]
MRKERKPNRSQPSLFQPPALTPAWPMLAPPVQQKVRTLLLHLFRQAHAARLSSQKKEAGNE